MEQTKRIQRHECLFDCPHCQSPTCARLDGARKQVVSCWSCRRHIQVKCRFRKGELKFFEAEVPEKPCRT